MVWCCYTLYLNTAMISSPTSLQPDVIFWFRRDLRLEDNAGLYHALKENESVQPVFIFDTEILDQLEDKQDKRVEFIHDSLIRI